MREECQIFVFLAGVEASCGRKKKQAVEDKKATEGQVTLEPELRARRFEKKALQKSEETDASCSLLLPLRLAQLALAEHSLFSLR